MFYASCFELTKLSSRTRRTRRTRVERDFNCAFSTRPIHLDRARRPIFSLRTFPRTRRNFFARRILFSSLVSAGRNLFTTYFDLAPAINFFDRRRRNRAHFSNFADFDLVGRNFDRRGGRTRRDLFFEPRLNQFSIYNVQCSIKMFW